MGKIINFPKNLEEQVKIKIENMNVDDIDEINDLVNLLLYNDKISIDHYMEYPIFKLSELLGVQIYTVDPDKLAYNDGVLFAHGTTENMYGYDPIIFIDESLDIEIQRDIAGYLLGTYLLDCLKNYSDTQNKTYVAVFDESVIHNKASYFTRQLLTPFSKFCEQYNKASNESNKIMFTLLYLSMYFKVSQSFIEERIYELAHGYKLQLETNNGIKLSKK